MSGHNQSRSKHSPGYRSPAPWHASLLLAGLMTPMAGMAEAPSVEDVDTRYWKCRFCPTPEGLKGEATLGLGGVTDNSVKHGEHNDLDEQRLFGVAAADLTWFGEEGRRYDLIARHLGLATRSVEITGTRPGLYELRLGYDELSHKVSDSGATPFRGNNPLSLPGNWVPGSTTGDMTELDNSLRNVNEGSDRQRINLGATLEADSHWTVYTDVEHENRDGNQVTGSNFVFSAAELLEPIDYETSTFSTGVRYDARHWDLGLAYKANFFSNDNRSLIWDNPYSSGGRGQMALPPDNQAHQINLQGGYYFSDRAVFSGNIALGRMMQDESFVQPTINPSLNAPGLPASNADAEVDTLNANARLSWTPPIAGLSTLLRYRANVRDDNTPERTFTQVITDTFVGGEARNEQLSYARHTVKASVRYRLNSSHRISGGTDFEAYDRNYGSDPSTREYTVWSKVRSRLTRHVQLTIKGARSWRNGSDNAPEVINGAPQNPDMVWFDVADRTQSRARAALSLSPITWLTTTLSGEFTLSDYDDTRIGRTERIQRSVNVDASVVPAEDTSLYMYYSRQFDAFNQNNSPGAGLLWVGETEDSFDTIGLGGRVNNIRDKLDLSVDITFSNSTGDTKVKTGTPTTPFPDFDNKRIALALSSDYRVSERGSLGLNLNYENYFTRKDWRFDRVAPDTAPGLLSLGRDVDSYQVLVATLVGRYRF